MKNESTEKYVNNRITSKKNQFEHWKNRKESGLIRLVERLLIGVNISDRLGGDGRAIKHLQEVNHQFLGTWTSDKSLEFDGKIDEGIILSDVNVDISSGLIRLENGYILDEFLPHWQNLIYSGGLASEYRSAGKKTSTIHGKWTSVSSTPYYYHFLIEDLARIAAIREYFPDIKVAILENQENWKIELLESFNFDYHIVKQRSSKFECYITSIGGSHQNSSGIEILRSNKLRDHASEARTTKLLITRKGLAREETEMENYVKEKLLSIGYIIVSPELLRIEEQIKLFRSATHIVGFHGGALANIIWSQPGTKIFEIQNHPYRTKDFEFLGKKLGMNYTALNSESKIKEFIDGMN